MKVVKLSLLRRHWLLVVLLVAGLTLRVLTWLAYQPALLYIDSFRYLDNLAEMSPVQLNPIGYNLVLGPLVDLGGLGLVSAVQHLGGIGIAIALYALARRHGARRWLAALAAAPILLDGYQLQIEQNIMSEVLFEGLIVGMLWVLLGRGEPSWRRAAFAGVLLGLAVITRTIGLTLIVPLVVYLVLVGRAWRRKEGWWTIFSRTGAAVVGMLVVLVAYAGYFQSFTGTWSITAASDRVSYGRAANIADCDALPLTDVTRPFCPPEPLDERKGVDFYAHYRYGMEEWPGRLPVGVSKDEGADEFISTVISNQPVDLALAVFGDFMKGFAPYRSVAPGDVPLDRWQFQLHYPTFYGTDPAEYTRAFDSGEPSANEGLAGFLRGYQLSVGYTPGTLLGIAGLLGLVASVGVGRASRSGIRSAALLAASSGFLILLGSAAFEFSWRYQLPGLVFLPLAGVLGVAALLGPTRRPEPVKGRRPKLAEFPDNVDAYAMAEFGNRYPAATMAPIVVVIAAYNEEKGIGSALANMPKYCADLPVDVLVVVDGSTDGTARIAAEAGAYVCVAPRNRGQGAALRLGYQLAAASGAEYVVTTDADGQYDNSELPKLIGPLLDDTADFVTGSRRLGSAQTDSTVRWVGVRVFAALASLLTWRRITDTSFGFRAMRAELACSVTLREPQYQSSELMLGLLALGARVLEVPATMRLRNNGASKKGTSLVYGANYARVMTGTWFREYVLRRRRRTRTGRTTRTSVRT